MKRYIEYYTKLNLISPMSLFSLKRGVYSIESDRSDIARDFAIQMAVAFSNLQRNLELKTNYYCLKQKSLEVVNKVISQINEYGWRYEDIVTGQVDPSIVLNSLVQDNYNLPVLKTDTDSLSCCKFISGELIIIDSAKYCQEVYGFSTNRLTYLQRQSPNNSSVFIVNDTDKPILCDGRLYLAIDSKDKANNCLNIHLSVMDYDLPVDDVKLKYYYKDTREFVQVV